MRVFLSMYFHAIFSLVVIPIVVGEKVSGCAEEDNAGVLQFGAPPCGTSYATKYNQLFATRSPIPKFRLQGLLQQYVLEHAEYCEPSVSHYVKLYMKVMDAYELLDYVQVKPNRWQQLETAILDADYQPTRQHTVRVKFQLADCSCVLRVYDLKESDTPGTATSQPCDTVTTMVNPYKVEKTVTGLTTPQKFFILGEYEKYPFCDPSKNSGVYGEFGPIHPHLAIPEYFTVTKGDTPVEISPGLTKYQAHYSEYREGKGDGGEVYGYVTLSYDGSDLKFFMGRQGTPHMVLDYLRVEPTAWKAAGQAILEGSPGPSKDDKLRLLYLTKDCDCVMRVYHLSEVNIPETAETRACNGRIMPGKEHVLAGTTHNIGQPNPKPLPGITTTFYGCFKDDNNGVINEFGSLPKDLSVESHYRKMLNPNIQKAEFQLEGTLKDFTVEYFEFEDILSGGKLTYSYLSLTYHKETEGYLLDYIRVNPKKWNQIENAIQDFEIIEPNIIRLQYLISDCTCVTREYDLKEKEFSKRGRTVNCPVALDLLSNPKTTSLTDGKF